MLLADALAIPSTYVGTYWGIAAYPSLEDGLYLAPGRNPPLRPDYLLDRLLPSKSR